jgi:hypothetical protein
LDEGKVNLRVVYGNNVAMCKLTGCQSQDLGGIGDPIGKRPALDSNKATTVSSGAEVRLVLNEVGAQGPRLAVLTGRQLVVDMRPVMGCRKR